MSLFSAFPVKTDMESATLVNRKREEGGKSDTEDEDSENELENGDEGKKKLFL